MTTAGRPTFEPARGGQSRGDLSAMSKQYSSRDLPSHKTLKYRQPGQGTVEETRNRDFWQELQNRDRGTKRPKLSENDSDTKKKKLELHPARNLDADDPQEDDSDSSDDDGDNEEALLAELDKIKKEREMEKAKQAMEKQKEDEQIRMENILNGNPLVTHHFSGTEKNYTVKRRWNDDVVFKNCARLEPDKTTKQFINDSLRSEFHRKFMNKYIQ